MELNATGPESDLEPIAKPSPEALAELEPILRRLRLYQSRGDRDAFRKTLDEAIAVAPGAPDVLLAQAQELIDRYKPADAAKLLKHALVTYPQHPELESLYGDCVLRAAGQSWGSGSMSDLEVVARGKTAVVLSALVPGLGHIVLGHFLTGGVIFLVFVLSIVWMMLIPNGLSGLLRTVSGGGGGSAADLNPTVFLPLFLALGTYLGTMASLNAQAKRITPTTKPRPVPPVEKDFEL